MAMVPVVINNYTEMRLSPGEHSTLIKDVIEEFASRFIQGSILVYAGDTEDKWGYFDTDTAKKIGISVNQHGKMPDIIFYVKAKKWLILVESVTSHGPVDGKRHSELENLFKNVKLTKVYVTAFPNKSTFSKYLADIAWETEVWISDNPTHMIHFNGDKFLGPYKS